MEEAMVNVQDTAGAEAVYNGGAWQSEMAKRVCESSYIEALKYKWIASEKAGRDLGDAAVAEWLKLHWPGWCREKWVEHLRGDCFWSEFGEDAFNAFRQTFAGDPAILESVTEKIRCGWENLDIILWASDAGLNIDHVLDILVIADINQRRIDESLFAEDMAGGSFSSPQ